MSLDLYQDETQQALDRLPSTPTGAIEAPFFQSFLPGGLKVMAGEMAKVGRAVSMAAGVVPVAADALANALPWLPGADMRESPTELQDRFFRQHDEVFGSAVKYWTPQPGEVGMAGEVVGSLAGMLPVILAGPAGPNVAVASQVLSQAEDLIDKGVSPTKAVGVGVAQGAGLATGIWMPILGQNLWQRVVLGGAGFNAVQGVTTRAVSQAILGDDKAAELYPTLGLKELTLDLLLGMAFGGVAHLSPEMRAQGKVAWARIATWAQDLTPAQVDAIAALRQAEHLNVETAPGTLKTPEDVEANVNRAKAALEQVLRDEPVQVEQMPAPRVEPDTARQVDAETRVAEMMADAERVRTEEGIPELLAAEPERPDMPALWGEIARLAPEEQPGAIGAAIERRLAELGVQANEAAANGAIWRSFFDTASKKYGVRAAELMQQYGIDVQRMQARAPGADAALAGAAEGGYGGGRGRLEQPPGNRPQPQDLRATVAGGSPEPGWIGATRIRRSGGGDPLPAYRGSELALTPEHFEPGALGVASGNPSSGLGVWFTTTRSEAATYGKVQEAYLDVRNPKVVKVEDLQGFETTALATAYREQLRAQGFDGMVVTAKHLGGKTHIVVFDAKQVIPIGGHGEYGQAVKPGPMFYSELARQIQSAKMEQAPAKGWKDYIRGLAQKGVKADEVKWSGIEEWLDLQQGKVTRQQVSDFLEKNGVRVEEVELGVDRDALYQDAKDEAARFGITGDLFSKFWGKRSNWRAEQPGEQYPYPDNDVGKKLRDLIEPIIAQRGEQTKYGQYQLPGAKPGSYRELLLTLPAREQDGLPKGYSIQPMARPRWENGVLQGEVGARFALVGPDGVGQRLDAVTEGEARAEAVRRLERQWGAAGTRPESFQSSHFEQPNILAHVRFNERTDADGKRVLFVEEIQSDWAQKGKRSGFATARTASVIEGERNALVRDRNTLLEEAARLPDAEMANFRRLIAEEQQLRARISELDAEHDLVLAKGPGVPAAPFVGKTEAWVGLVLKRMIRYASEHGFDRVAWTRGEQQVDRYTSALRKAVDTIEWTKTPEGVQLVGYKGKPAPQKEMVPIDTHGGEIVYGTSDREYTVSHAAGFPWHWDGPGGTSEGGFASSADAIAAAQRFMKTRGGSRSKVVDTTEKENALSDAIGKAMAERILKDPNQSGTIEGEGIKIDDTGMASFYDRIVPNVAKEILKKLGGGKVGEVTIGGGADLESFDITETGGRWQLVDRETNQAVPDAPSFRSGADAEAWVNENRGIKQPAFDITPAMREKALAGQSYFQANRGQINFADGSTIISLFEGANASTFAHETGHLFLQIIRDLANRADAPAAAVADWATLENWLGIERNEVTVEAHEKFARGWEKYLAEGVAPTPELKSVFQQFRDWLLQVYRTLTELDVNLNDEIRGVMDRMLASEAADPTPARVRATTEAEGAPAPTGRAVPPPPRGEAGEARATPEAQDEPDPWLMVARENEPAAEPAPARGLEDQEVRDILLLMAEHEAGWAEIGGRHLGGEMGQPNFSAWVPRADWWPKREGKLNEVQTREAVRKALAGEKLKKKEQLAIDYMVKIAGERANDVQTVGKDEWELTAAEVAAAGLEPSTRNVVDAALLARANEISEGAVERLAVMFENDDAGFMAAVRRMIDENHQQGRRIRADLEAARRGQETGGQAPGPAGAEPQGPAGAGAGEPAAGSGAGQRPAAEPQGPAGADAAVDPLRQAVDDIVAADPNRMIVVGRNPDGTPIARTVGEYLEEARMQTELARQDAGLFEIAARCMLGGQ